MAVPTVMDVDFGDEDDGDDYNKEAKNAEQKSEDPVELRLWRLGTSRSIWRNPESLTLGRCLGVDQQAADDQVGVRTPTSGDPAKSGPACTSAGGHGRFRRGPRDEQWPAHQRATGPAVSAW